MRRMITNKQVDTVNLAEELFKYLEVQTDPYHAEYHFYFNDSHRGQKIIFTSSLDGTPIIDGVDNDGEEAIGLFNDGGDAAVSMYFDDETSISTQYPLSVHASDIISLEGNNIQLTSPSGAGYNKIALNSANAITMEFNSDGNDSAIIITNGDSGNSIVWFNFDDNVIFPSLPTSDPRVAGAIWNDNGIMKVSSGN